MSRSHSNFPSPCASKMLIALLAALGSGLVGVAAASGTPHVPQGPKFDWDTLPVFCESNPATPCTLCTISMWPMAMIIATVP